MDALSSNSEDNIPKILETLCPSYGEFVSKFWRFYTRRVKIFSTNYEDILGDIIKKFLPKILEIISPNRNNVMSEL